MWCSYQACTGSAATMIGSQQLNHNHRMLTKVKNSDLPALLLLPLLRCRFTISRRPLQQGQGGALVPGCAPVPPQCRQASITCTSTSCCAPRIASRKPSCSRACTSGAAAPLLLRVLRLPPPLLLLAPQRDSSYCRRCSGLDRTSKAWLINCGVLEERWMRVECLEQRGRRTKSHGKQGRMLGPCVKLVYPP